MIEAVVTHHRHGFRSGVARFNELLAGRLGVPLLGLDEPWPATALLSFKVGELSDAERETVGRKLDGWAGAVYLHEWSGLPLEREIVERAAAVHSGNLEIQEHAAALNPAAAPVWTPGLLIDRRAYEPAELTVFSFGMAHKVRTDMFRRLRSLLDALGAPYAVYVSAANHETTTLEDAQAVFEKMHELFPSLYFLGNLSDVAVYNRLRESTFFAAFFDRGVRANNTSVAAAMETGAVVMTNLDGLSPPEYVHGENVIDIERCDRLPTDPAVLDAIRARAVETAAARGWEALVARMAE